jgi:insulysin
MLKYKPEHILYGPYYNIDISIAKNHDKFKEIMNECLDYYQRDNSVVVISSKKFQGKTSKVEKWYNVEYNRYTDPTEIKGSKKLKMDVTKLHLPKENKYIPRNINVYPQDKKSKQKYPELINKNNKDIRIWFKKDNTFMKPKVMFLLQIYTPNMYKTAQNYVTINLLIKTINDILSSDTYYASIAGSIHNILMGEENINIYMDAYNEVAPKLLDTILDKVFNFDKMSEDVINRNMDDYRTNIENYIYKPLFLLGSDHLREKTYIDHYTFLERLDALKTITHRNISDTEKIRDILFKECHIECLIQGNVGNDDVKKISKVLKKYDIHKLSKLNVPHTNIGVDVLGNGEEEIYIRKNYNKNENDSLINAFFEVGQIKEGVTKNWDLKLFKLMLINRLTQERFFDQLRSKEQSGYIVKSFINKLGSPNTYDNRAGYVIGLSFVIQSHRKNPVLLRKRIKKFITSMGEYIKNMSDAEFKEHTNVFVINLKKDHNNLQEEFYHNMESIIDKHYVFDIEEQLASSSNKITKKNVYNFYRKHFLDRRSRKIRVVEMYSNNHLK